MKNSDSSENYLKKILVLHTRNGHVRAVDVAAELGVTKPSVSAAMKKLRKQEMIYLDEEGYICLTGKGRSLAEKVNRKHILLTNFLIGIGVNEKTASEEACLIEHDIGEETMERLEELYEREFS
ncbi:MAG: metal-dependent transcriptional regulator [Lachnospiraceae bacterium]|nr:metal-dependent transcriptional regulator [Lachnospiraceae bacterium]